MPTIPTEEREKLMRGCHFEKTLQRIPFFADFQYIWELYTV